MDFSFTCRAITIISAVKQAKKEVAFRSMLRCGVCCSCPLLRQELEGFDLLIITWPELDHVNGVFAGVQLEFPSMVPCTTGYVLATYHPDILELFQIVATSFWFAKPRRARLSLTRPTQLVD
ncbi:uncharacterized protein ZBAI_02696 [Zygosaccharomyces bailii ISA1307]|nr:uncharacterized protein ZBAI_02696 [Zygosaccharomyces bailii ISA1307]